MTQRTSEEVMREEFERLFLEKFPQAAPQMTRFGEGAQVFNHQAVGDYSNSWIQSHWEGFQLGQKSLAGKVPAEAIARGTLSMDALIYGKQVWIAEHQHDDLWADLCRKEKEWIDKILASKAELETLLATIRSLQ